MDFGESLRETIREIVKQELERNTREAPATTLVGTVEAAAHADVTERTIRRWIRTGRLTARKAGRVIRVDLDELDDLIRKDGRVRSTANGGTLRNGNQEARDLTPEELAARDFGA